MDEHDLEQEELNDLAWIMSITKGRRFINRLINAGLAVAPIGADPYGTYYNAGRRHVADALEAELRADHLDEYLLMLRESQVEDPSCKSEES